MQTTLTLLLTLLVNIGGGTYRHMAAEMERNAGVLPVPVASAQEEAPVPEVEELAGEDERILSIAPAQTPLLIVGEGGDAGALFGKAAETFQREEGGEIAYVRSGDEMLLAMRKFVRTHGRITQLVYFGHGNHVGLYVNQGPGNGALYANDPDINRNFAAASIYSLRPATFAPNGEAVFFGCNVANGYPERDTLAERFANHFRVRVHAVRGPMEFSRIPNAVDPFPFSQYLPGSFDEPVYMVPSSVSQGIVVIDPSAAGIGGYLDVYSGMDNAEAIGELTHEGLSLSGEEGKFHPYRNITYEDAQRFCRVAVGDDAPCSLSAAYEYGPNDPVRNLHALKMLTEAFGFRVPHSLNSHLPFLRWAWGYDGLLTPEFDQKKWYTRAEMAALTQNFMERFKLSAS